ncbi:MAG: site-specific integrase [Candidatus Thiodiazotropha sp.]|nr:site-specific integrase [Candidatus Thiodiazotropha sp.]MCM8921458.1 site-specific integrase [Candidatus Thiodiazotropha sp.]
MPTATAIKLPKHEPRVRRTKAGYEFELNDSIWQLDGSRQINFATVSDIVPSGVRQGLVLATARMAQQVSAMHTRNCYQYLVNFFFRTPHYTGGAITDNQLLNLKASLDKGNEYKLGTIRGFLMNWEDWGYGGLDKGLGKFLESLTLKGNVKGKAVLTRCPHSGPYTKMEQEMLLKWAGEAFKVGEISLEKYAWFYVVFVTARRPVQLRSLRIRDLERKYKKTPVTYNLVIPRAKQRGGGFRMLFRSLKVTEDVFLVLLNLADAVRSQALQHLPDLTEEDVLELPVFLESRRFFELESVAQYRRVLGDMPDYLHKTANNASAMSNSISEACTAKSERTQDYIHFTPTRCRRTRATNLVRHGISGVQLAYLMDHEDTQQIGVYTQYTPELAMRINELMGPTMSFLAAAFEGRFIASESGAKRAGDPNSRIYDKEGRQVANCGGSPACMGGIKSCVTCGSFQPHLHADWDGLLIELVEEREEREKMGAGEDVLQSYNLPIAYTKAIIDACQEELSKEALL